MTITLDRRPTAVRPSAVRPTAVRPSAVRPTAVRPAAAPRPAPRAAEEGVTITLTVTLPAGTGDVEAAIIADELRTHAQRQAVSRQGRTAVTVSSPLAFRAATPGAARPLPPRAQASVPVSPLRPRRAGVVSPTSPARRDVEAARRRALAATAVSPASPSAVGVDTALVIDLYGRRVRIDGADVDFTYKEFELLAHLARNARSTITREQLMESVWSQSPAETGERTVDVHVRRVRSKLGRYRRLISTVRGAGYRLDPGSDVSILG